MHLVFARGEGLLLITWGGDVSLSTYLTKLFSHNLEFCKYANMFVESGDQHMCSVVGCTNLTLATPIITTATVARTEDN